MSSTGGRDDLLVLDWVRVFGSRRPSSTVRTTAGTPSASVAESPTTGPRAATTCTFPGAKARAARRSPRRHAWYEAGQLMSSSETDRHWFLTRAEQARTVLEPVALILAGVWAFFIYSKEKIVAPHAIPANVSISSKLVLEPSSPNGDLVPVLVQLKLTNTSSVRSYVPLSRWRLLASGIISSATTWKEATASLRESFLVDDTVNVTHMTFSGTGYQLISMGKVFPSSASWLDPSEGYSREILVFVPKRYSRVRLLVDTWSCRTLDGWRAGWRVDDSVSDLTSAEIVSPLFEHSEWLSGMRSLNWQSDPADRTIVSEHFVHSHQIVDQLLAF